MYVHFGSRNGDRHNWTRDVLVREADGNEYKAVLGMVTNSDGTRRASACVWDNLVWGADLPEVSPHVPPPLRLTAVAAGLCDENGNSGGLPAPDWIKR